MIGELDITNIFRDHFTVKSRLKPSQTVLDAELSRGQVYNLIKARDIRTALRRMERGKSPGYDGLSIEHLRCADPHIATVLALFFNLFVTFTPSF